MFSCGAMTDKFTLFAAYKVTFFTIKNFGVFWRFWRFWRFFCKHNSKYT